MDAFLSYGSEDQDVAQRLAGDLERAGVTVWSYRTAIRPGQDWAKEMSRGISEARNVLFIVPDRAGSGQSSEIALAVASQRSDPTKRIVPILAHRSAKLPFFLRRYQALDLSSDTAYEQGLPRLVRLLRGAPLPESHAESDQVREHILSAQRDLLRVQYAELTREVMASNVKIKAGIIAGIGGAAVVIVVVGIALLSALNGLGGATLPAIMVGALAGILGLLLGQRLFLIFCSGRSERDDE